MRILMIAPQPFFSPRGTPFSVLGRCRALSALGHEVDLLTYPLGEDVSLPGLRILRGPRVPGIRAVKIGPSAAKLPLDSLLFARTLLQLARRRYDVIHTHEEAGIFGWLLSRITGIPHLYDMHSDLAQQFTNFGFSESHPLTRLAAWTETRALRSARSVIVVCADLVDRALAYAADCAPLLIENVPVEPPPSPEQVRGFRSRLAPTAERLVVYTGTLEPYQGMPELLSAFARVLQEHPAARLVVAGGRADQVAALREQAERERTLAAVHLLGTVAPEDAAAVVAAADVLVSPRSRGSNTPLKIYAYLRSGRPIVATRILTHTQVLDDSVAVLVEPGPDGLAGGILRLLRDPGLAARVGEAAMTLAAERYSPRIFLERTAQSLARLGRGGAGLPLEDALRLLEAA